MPTIHINIGSNQGDRSSYIETAVALISKHIEHSGILRSRIYHSHAWGYDSDNEYLNLALALDTDITVDPVATLRTLLEIERKISSAPHRDSTGAYVDRCIDVDLIAIDAVTINTPELALPHPRMHLRDFVVKPMAEIAPQWLHPLLHLTATELAGRL